MGTRVFKYGDFIPCDVTELQESGGNRFVRDESGKGWTGIGDRYAAGKTYQNDGALLWEWGQRNALEDVTPAYDAAVEYFRRNDKPVWHNRSHFNASEETKRHLIAIIEHIQRG